MIQNAHKISVDSPEFRASFQQEIFDHWLELKGDLTFPNKKGFRPQKFPHFLGQIAIVSVDDNGVFSDRLTGGIICEVLKLSDGPEKLTSVPDARIRETINKIIHESYIAAEPMYYTGRLHPPIRPPVDFSVLIVPFAEDTGAEGPTSLLFAFDFTKRAASSLLAAAPE